MQENVYNMIRRANLNPGSQVNINDYVNIVGRVVAVPRSVCKRMDYKGFSAADVQVGDRLLFSYLVVGEIEELEGGEARHKNSVVIKGKEYFLCDVRQAFAVIRGEEIIMLNDYVMISPPNPPVSLILPAYDRKVRKWVAKAAIQAVGRQNKVKFSGGEEVYVDFAKTQHYKLQDSKFGIIESKYIYAAEKNN
jgi:co-chaperonin GroES (HSP10)